MPRHMIGSPMPRFSLRQCLLSGFLLTLAFPNFNFGYLAWIALIPWIQSSLNASGRRQALLGGFSAGLVFFALSMSWIIHVVWFGWVFVACLEALFGAIFSWLVYEGGKIRTAFLRALWTACSWTFAEYLRSEIPVFGLPWNLLAASQTGTLEILQSVNIFGAYGLGFLIALVNAGIVEMFQARRCEIEKRRLIQIRDDEVSADRGQTQGAFPRSIAGGVLSLGLIFLSLWGYGKISLGSQESSGTVRAAVLQGNIAQEIKWSPEAKSQILQIYLKMTELAAAAQPDLVVWPEAAFPGYLNLDPEAVQVMETVRRIQVPALIGSPHLETRETAYNSAYLFGADGNLEARYDKQHLVPFGEYVPLIPVLGWLEPLAYRMGVSDFSSGKTPLVFKLPRVGFPFSTLICFEDVFPDLARRFVKEGARFLVVMTNDAWFGPSQAPYQHLQASILRAVENGVPLIRAANTGISGMIDAKGRELTRVRDEQGRDIFSFGWAVESVQIPSKATFYQRRGFHFSTLLFAAWALAFAGWQIRKRLSPGEEDPL